MLGFEAGGNYSGLLPIVDFGLGYGGRSTTFKDEEGRTGIYGWKETFVTTGLSLPLDLSWVMSRAFRAIRPQLCLLMELEVWPNLIATARRHDIPVAVVNGRISDRSYPTYRRFRPLLHRQVHRGQRIFRRFAGRSTVGDDPGRRW